ncbi:hypothetical protein [Arthrobacter sp. efr-133-TYG-118]|uniref:hypothetical protein n=1 Tax=Arthrobacter sp. efr-133-TYG-118 TaxID=3040279 RepID=UPI00254BE044|nr:hypothetical protein [Arthrobacter sp. efr-133-TYG-118]
MSDRDELDAIHAHLLADAKRQPEYANNQVSALYGYSEGAEHALDVVRLKGYVKHRTITTTAEVDALPDGSIIRTCFGIAVTIYRAHRILTAEGFHHAVKHGPATVLFEPEEGTLT